MKKSIKITLILLCEIIIVSLLFFIISGYLIGGGLNKPFTEENAYEIFTQNQYEIEKVKNHLIGDEFYDSYIPDTTLTDEIISVNGQDKKLDDKEIVACIKKMQKQGCTVISESNNIVSFVMWSNLDVGKGFVFSKSGEEPTQNDLQFLTKLSPLEYQNWFYYEEDFNEWERMNGR